MYNCHLVENYQIPASSIILEMFIRKCLQHSDAPCNMCMHVRRFLIVIDPHVSSPPGGKVVQVHVQMKMSPANWPILESFLEIT